MQRIKQVKLSLPGLCCGRGSRGDGRFWSKRSDSEVSVELSLEVEFLLWRKRNHYRVLGLAGEGMT